MVGYLILHPLAGSYVKLYFAGAILATVFEFLVGKLMVKLFGELWWDYNDKPCNYKGIICLESTIAWGFYAVIIICFLNGKVMHFIDSYSYEMGVRACKIVIVLGTIDFTYQLLQALHFNLADSRDKVLQLYERFKTKWN